MQIRLWGTSEENKYILELLKRELKEKIKIISPPYASKTNNTQRIYVETDLENRNYRKNSIKTDHSETEKTKFNEQALFEEIKKKIN